MTTFKKWCKTLLLLATGGLLSHFLIGPMLQNGLGEKWHDYSSTAMHSEMPEGVSDSLRFAHIEHSMYKQLFEEFYAEFGSDAILKYEQYMRQKFLKEEDVFLYGLTRHDPSHENLSSKRFHEGFPDSERGGHEQFGIQSYSQDELDNRSNQLNDNNDSYWQSRGYDERPF